MSNDFNQPSDNPYQTNAPVNFNLPASNEKPPSMVVFGILNLVFALFGLCGIIGGIAMQFVDLPGNEGNPMLEAMKAPNVRTVMLVFQVLNIPMVILLLVSGIGLLNGRGYGRKCAIYYSILASIMLLVGFVVNLVFLVLPTFPKAMEMPEGPQKMQAIQGLVSLLFQPCGLIYPILLLIFMYRNSVKNYLRSRGELT